MWLDPKMLGTAAVAAAFAMALQAQAAWIPRQQIPRSSSPIRRQSANDSNLSESLIILIERRLAETATGSWENGTRAQALLEYHWPQLSVFSNRAIPIIPSLGIPTSSNEIAALTVAKKPNSTMMFCVDQSAADPASLGVSIILANATQSSVDYMADVREENEYLYFHAPRTADGALSHRVAELQLWSDFMAMVPPYLAYYGAVANDSSFIEQAYFQLNLYRNYLVVDNSTGLLRHIMFGSPAVQDLDLWTTGNAWAAWGMARVLATMLHSGIAWDYRMENLRNWSVQILRNSFTELNTTTGLLPNYLQSNDTSVAFPDAASTALLAAVSYRLAQMKLDNSTLTQADSARRAVFAAVNTTTGWLSPVVDPYDWSKRSTRSPEGQSFVVILAASYRDYLNTPR